MKLNREFYLRPTLLVAQELLGKHLVRETAQGRLVGEINEVEVYLGAVDPASHAARGQTTRNSAMFKQGGHAYLYAIYGKHICMNVVTEGDGQAAAVLIRSVIPVQGQEILLKNRRLLTTQANSAWISGPAKVCQAFGLSLAQNSLNLVYSPDLYLEDVGKSIQQFKMSPRIGISQATSKLWRYFYS